MKLQDTVLWSHSTPQSLVRDLHLAGIASAEVLARLLAVPASTAPFAAIGMVDWALELAAPPTDWATTLGAEGTRADWLAALRSPPLDEALRARCRAEVGDHPVDDPDALATMHLLDQGVPAVPAELEARGLPAERATRGLALLTLAGWVVERPDHQRVLVDHFSPSTQASPARLPPPTRWTVGPATGAFTDHLSSGPLRPLSTLNVVVTSEAGQEEWVVLLLEFEDDDWQLRFPTRSEHCVRWTDLRTDPNGRRILGINTGSRTGRRRWAVGLVPRAMLEQTVFANNLAGLRAAVSGGLVQLQAYRADVEAPS